MGPKFGFIQLTLLLSYLCLIEDVGSKPQFGLGAVVKTVKNARKIVNVINDITTLVLGIDGMIDLFMPDNSEEEFRENVTRKLDDINNKIENMDKGIAQLGQMTVKNTAQIIWENALEEDKNYLQEIMRKLNIIETRFKKDFSNIYQGIKNYRHESIDSFISSIIDNNDLKDKLIDIEFATKLSDSLNLYARKNIFEIAISYSANEKSYHRDCNTVSAKDRFFFFYDYIVKTVIKGYTMIIMAYQYRKMKSSDPAFNTQRQHEYQNFQKQTIVLITDAFKAYMNSINTIDYKSAYACDSQKWKEGQSYIRVKNYVGVKTTQPCITTFTMSYSEEEDRKKLKLCDCIPKKYQSQSNKEFVVSKPCPLPFQRNPDKTFASRQEFSQFRNQSNRVTVLMCESLATGTDLTDACSRDQNSDPVLSVRKISLLPAECFPEYNQIMTSARFYEKDGIIRIEAQCGVLKDGRIIPNFLSWHTWERDAYTRENHHHHVVLDWRKKTFNLDDIILPDGEFVTSVGFKLDGTSISLEVKGTKMYDGNNNNGIDGTETNVHNPVRNNQILREELQIDRNQPFAYTQNGQTYEMSRPGHHYVTLSMSNRTYIYGDYKSIIPFFDMNEYTTTLALPLGGIGIMYKSVPGYTGFLAFKFITSKYTSFISDDYATKLKPKIYY